MRLTLLPHWFLCPARDSRATTLRVFTSCPVKADAVPIIAVCFTIAVAFEQGNEAVRATGHEK